MKMVCIGKFLKSGLLGKVFCISLVYTKCMEVSLIPCRDAIVCCTLKPSIFASLLVWKMAVVFCVFVYVCALCDVLWICVD